MRKCVDLVGQRFGKLEVVSYSHSRNGAYWLCKCDCGNTSVARGTSLRAGEVKSCGCGSLEAARKNAEASRTKHGFAHKERLYETWKNMKRRCYNPTNKRAKFYAEKCVTVCDEWRDDYLAFRSWALANGYNDTLKIDRIDNDGDYCPENCRWATDKVQANNQSRNRLLTYNGETLTMAQWADKLGYSYSAINHRVQRGWSMERIVNTPQRRHVDGRYIV